MQLVCWTQNSFNPKIMRQLELITILLNIATSQQPVSNYMTSSKLLQSRMRITELLRYQDSSFIAGVVPHDNCFFEVVTKLNLNQNIFGRLYPVFFHPLCVSIGY